MMNSNLVNPNPKDMHSISQFILASSSPRRKELVAALDLSLPVFVFSIDTDENIEANWTPQQAVEQLSLLKAQSVEKAINKGECPPQITGTSQLILAADTIVVLDGQILGKPSSTDEARETLKKLQGRAHQVYTGVTLIETGTGASLTKSRSTVVHMLPLTESTIRSYVATGEPMDKAGSYGIQGKGALLIERIEGCYFNVVGLPVSLVGQMLQKFNVNVL